MGFFFDMLLVTLTAILLVGITSVIIYFKYFAFTYWQKRGLAVRSPTMPIGNMGSALLGEQTLGELVQNMYDEFKRKGLKHAGFYFFNSPIYIPLDPDIIKHILIKDSQHFADRGVYSNEKNEPLSVNLFAIEGTKWRTLRGKLSPTFTAGKMKMMFQTLIDCSEELKLVCDKAADSGEILEIKDVSARFTTDIIGSCAFGLDCNSLKNPDAEFRKMGRMILDHNFWQTMSFLIGNGFPALAHLLNLRMFNEKASTFFLDVVRQTIDHREKTNLKRNDFLQLLIQLKNDGRLEGDDGDIKSSETNNGTNITFNEAAAQAFVFFLAGFETSSTLMTFCLFELSINAAAQDKLREEVVTVVKEFNGEISYDCIMKMPYMEKVVQETLRKYPVVPVLSRKCNSNYKVPNTDLVLERGTIVFVPVLGLQRDAEYYPNPDMFNPERFSEASKATRPACVHLPFGAGPRNCIGLRFGLMQAKVGLAVLISRYAISLNEKTQWPFKFAPKSFTLTPEGGLWLNVKKIVK